MPSDRREPGRGDPNRTGRDAATSGPRAGPESRPRAGARGRRKEARAAGTLGRGRGVGARSAAAHRRESPGHERPPRLCLCCHPARPRPAGGRSPGITAQLAAVREERLGAATHASPLPARVSGRAWAGSLGVQSAQKGGGGEGERIVERPRVTLHEGPCEGDSNRKVGVHT